MKCLKCGMELFPENRFCTYCGAKIEGVLKKGDDCMCFTAAVCPQCGAGIEVDASKENAICPYCNTSILIEPAIKRIQLDTSADFRNNISMARKMMGDTNYNYTFRLNEALKYCRKALELNPNSWDARQLEQSIINLLQQGAAAEQKRNGILFIIAICIISLVGLAWFFNKLY